MTAPDAIPPTGEAASGSPASPSCELRTYYLYCLLENKRTVRYFGISSQSSRRRLAQHISDSSRNRNDHKANWIRNCISTDIRIDMHMIRDGLSYDDACILERKMIRFFKKAFNLVNSHDGGNTGYAGLSEESRKKHRENSRRALGLDDPEIASERGRRIVKIRWDKDRIRRNEYAARHPLPERKIVRRIYVIERELEMRGITMYNDDSERECRRKLRSIGL